MNHRQWKKKFKKIHGRNPNIYEDRHTKSDPTIRHLAESFGVFQDLVGKMTDSLRRGLYALGVSLETLGRSMREQYKRDEVEE